MDNWVVTGIGGTLAVVQLVLFESVRRRQKIVFDKLVEAQQIDRIQITNREVEQALATIWQRTCLRRISMMAPMLGVVLTAAGFLTLRDRLPFEVR
ncbi:MAG TPA: hypothetical protein DDY91_04280, partial [Planctomycetaceae bacterium]|nr:hypothetical protein [Planctomycetaceae bacterium]